MSWATVWLVATVGVTLFPFHFRLSPAIATRALDALSPLQPTTLSELVCNVLLFVPFGWLVHGDRRGTARPRSVVRVTALGFGLSLAIECLQLFLPRRDTSVLDIAANTAGTLAGSVAHSIWGISVDARLADLRRTDVGVPVTFAALTVLTGAALVASAALQRSTRLIDWSGDYPLMLGNERTGHRPWRGRVSSFEFTDASTPSAVMRRFSRGETVALPGHRIAAYDFRGAAAPYRDGAGNLPILQWTGPLHEFEDDTGVVLSGHVWLSSVAPVETFAHAVRRSNAFSIRIVCTPDDLEHTGPARIVSNSFDPVLRNFTIGQQRDALVVRVRNAHSGPNGARPEVVVPHAFAEGEPRDLLVTYDGATLRSAVANSGRIHVARLTPGSSLALKITSLDIESDDLPMLQAIYLAALAAPAGALIALAGKTRRASLAGGALWVGVFAVLLEATLVAASGKEFDFIAVGLTAAIAASVVTTVIMISTADRTARR